jgi:hypothetical protein
MWNEINRPRQFSLRRRRHEVTPRPRFCPVLTAPHQAIVERMTIFGTSSRAALATTHNAGSRSARRRRARGGSRLLGSLAILGVTFFPTIAGAQSTITIDGTAKGPVFGGIGAISGGGGNSRLLYDYPEPQRSQILDFLFAPGMGANLQILKVEIGGNTNSTDGAESSHEATKGAIDCNTGYEWWLMKEAKARNPNIKLYGLAWGAPGWLGGGNFWSSDTIDYLLAWLQCAQGHGLTIDYLGGWNERGYNIAWYKQLRSHLNASPYSAVRVVGSDTDWSIANDMVNDPTFASSVDIIGVHYPCGGDQSNAQDCSGTPANAIMTGKPLWASENGSQDYIAGSSAMACAISRGYFEGQMTAYINWPLVASIYENLPFATVGLVVAPSPWSGHYLVGSQTWIAAHYTQFSAPGWTFLGPGGSVAKGGTYFALRNPVSNDYSLILETTTAPTAQTVSFQLQGGLSTGTVHVWGTNAASSDPSTWFNHEMDITPNAGTYSFNAQPGFVYSFGTIGGQGKSAAPSPPRAPLALPYADTFDSYDTGGMAKYLSNLQGDFQIEPCTGGRSGKCVTQMANTQPIEWNPDANPYALLGDLSWQNYSVSVDVLLEQPGAVQIMGRVGVMQPFSPPNIDAYVFQVGDTGDWSIGKNVSGVTSAAPAGFTTLKSGTIPALGTQAWHTLRLSFQGDQIAALVDGNQVGSVTDATYASGQVGIAVVGYETPQFDNLSIQPNTPAPLYTIVNSIDGLCLGVAGGSTDPGSLIEQDVCTCTADQQWYVQGDTLLNLKSGLALDVPSIGPIWPAPGNPGMQVWGPSAPGAQLDQRPPNGSPNQRFSASDAGAAPDGSLVTFTVEGSGLGVAVAGQSSQPGAAVIQDSLDGGAPSTWLLVNAVAACPPPLDAGTDSGDADSGPMDTSSASSASSATSATSASSASGEGGGGIVSNVASSAGAGGSAASGSSGGCSCTTVPTSGTPDAYWLGSAALVLLSRRWRRRGRG